MEQIVLFLIKIILGFILGIIAIVAFLFFVGSVFFSAWLECFSRGQGIGDFHYPP